MDHRYAAVWRTALAGALALHVCGAAVAQPSPAFKRLAPKGLADSQKLWNYSQAIVLEPGARLLEVAGTTGDQSTQETERRA
jgi:hypothetical protein